MVFELASTNLVIELGIILLVLLGWQFTAAEFVGGIIMIILIALIFRLTLTPHLVIFADLIILPILDIYRKYYGWKIMSYILLTFYITMAIAGCIVELLFEALGIIPQNRNVGAITEGIQWNYTTILNIIFLVLAALLIVRFIRTGGIAMLRIMSIPEQDMHHNHTIHDAHASH